MTDDTDNTKVQKAVFIICLLLLIMGVITIFTTGYNDLFKFRTPVTEPLSTKQQPYFIIMIFALVGMFLSGRNLRRIKKRHRN
jgi:cell division protein FtsW (lipid II flippase)